MAKKPYQQGDIITWSPSRVNTFRKCARMFLETSLLQTVPFEQSDAQKEGDRVHRALDARIKGTCALSPHDMHLEPLVQSIINAPGTTFAEQKMTINNQLKPTGWFASDAWCRIIVDVMKINGAYGFMGDWKTGTPRFEDYQLKLNAAIGFVYYEGLQQITTAYIWLKTKMLDPKVYTRADLPRMWLELLQDPVKMQQHSNAGSWPERPGKHCGWCGVNKQGRCRVAGERYRGA